MSTSVLVPEHVSEGYQENSDKVSEARAMELYMEIGSYIGVIDRYANPQNWGKWEKYTRLKHKILQWQRNI
ncbi:hypothetical protein Goe24_02290 [Bacillus phage vB_BsuM-Goe24]|nr:hypothetical protein Goe7_c02270 [Bacillus phage vB_BveM-Goe7]UJJ74779.1 hypothetical protein [Bacillus phage BM-P1]WCS69604.1 hypothetical protein Goe24_02290 [Bacillus phage vB_BsuM-Goe24]WCS69855.1 hypothetical protein Goe25_02270 [Bacillus phage vB_BsuM-Goe25]